MLTLYRVETYKNNVLQSTQRTNYKDWGNNIVLSKTVQILKGTPSLTNILEDRVVYHSYDDKGNPVELSKKMEQKFIMFGGTNKRNQ